MDERNRRMLAAGVGLFRNLVGIGVGLYIILSEKVLGRMAQTEDETLRFFAGGLKVLLILFLITLVASTVQYAVLLFILLRGEEETPFGRRFIRITDTIRSSTGYLFLMVFGVIFGAMGVFALTAPEEMKNGDPTTFLIVSLIFAAIGLGMVIYATIRIIKNIRDA